MILRLKKDSNRRIPPYRPGSILAVAVLFSSVEKAKFARIANMGRGNAITNKVLAQLNKIPYATPYNFIPWTVRTAKTTVEAEQWPYKILNRFLKSGEAKLMTVYPMREREVLRKFEMFFTCRAKNIPSVPIYEKAKNLPDNMIARSMLEHESGLMDILLAFINLYPDCEVRIDTRPLFKYEQENKDGDKVRKNYRPDAVVRMKTLDGKSYHFIVEFERSATNEAIRANKFAINRLLGKPQDHGLAKYTKFLYVYSRENYNVYTRPLDYGSPTVRAQHQSIENDLLSLIRGSSIDDRYRFLAFHDFYRLNKAVWLNSKCEKVQLLGS